jgi:hypothetical protein
MRSMLAIVVALVGVTLGLATPSAPDDSEARPSPYKAWTAGPPPDPSFFPIGVWLQDPANAAAYRELAINTYVGLWNGPTEDNLARLQRAGMRLICEQSDVALRHIKDATIVGWLQADEPDNAQDAPGGGYGPAIPTEKVGDAYRAMRREDPTRPVVLNLGQGVANDEWIGIGCDRSAYPAYVQACDIVSFDVFPVTNIGKSDGQAYLWYVAKGVDRLREWSGGRKPIWNFVECTRVGTADNKPTPQQTKAMVWMALIHGSMGIVYYAHQLQPTFIEAGLLADPEMRAAVRKINEEIISLAPVLNSETLRDGARVRHTNGPVPVDVMAKRHGGYTYVFAVGMRNGVTDCLFTVDDVPESSVAEVIGEGRTIPVVGGEFKDRFGLYGVHLYRIGTAGPTPSALGAVGGEPPTGG